MFNRIKDIVYNIFENFSEMIRLLSLLFVILCWLILGIVWTGSVRVYYYIKQRIEKIPWNFTLYFLKISEKVLTFFKK